MASQAVVESDNPLRKFDEGILKSMGSREVDAGAPRAMFLPSTMAEAMEVAKLMAAGNFVAPHLRGKPGDCLAVVMQATRWAMDPFAVANKSYFVNDRMAYESQLVTAVINSSHVLDGRLQPSWQGEGNDLVCTVRGRLKGDPEIKERRVPIKNITTRNSPLWKSDPEQQLAYYAMRAWVRLHAPEVLMGVYTPEELGAEQRAAARDGGALAPQPLTGAMLIGQAAAAEPQQQQTMGEQLGDNIPALDSKPNDIPLSDESPSATEGPAHEPRGEAEADYLPAIRDLRKKLAEAKTVKAVGQIDTEWCNTLRNSIDDERLMMSVDRDIASRKRELLAQAEG